MSVNPNIPIQNIYYMLSYAFQVLQEEGYKKLGMEEFDNATDKFNEYIEEYKQINKYWRIYEDSLIDPEEASYLPKDAVSISGYLVWEDYTRYQGDVKD